MKNQWLKHCVELAKHPADFYSGCRKILAGVTLEYENLDQDLWMEDSGYTKNKTQMLVKNYLHEESKAVAIELWNKRIKQRKYGSVGFTCYAHFVKGGSVDAKRSKRASVFGPCLQSVVLTYENDHRTRIDVFHRTTELFKKFPADLVFLRDQLLKGFDLSRNPLSKVVFHFANVTCHPMYFVNVLCHLPDPIKTLESMKVDRRFYDWAVKWTARYVVPEYHRGIEKFSQAMRVSKDVNFRLGKRKLIKPLVDYLKKNHPGYRKDYVAPVEDEDEDE